MLLPVPSWVNSTNVDLKIAFVLLYLFHRFELLRLCQFHVHEAAAAQRKWCRDQQLECALYNYQWHIPQPIIRTETKIVTTKAKCRHQILKWCSKGWAPRGELPYNSDGDIVVSLWGVNCRFWFQLGCLGWKVTLFAQFRYRLILYMEKFTKNVLTLTTQ